MRHEATSGFVIPVRADEVAKYFVGQEEKNSIYTVGLLEFPGNISKGKLPVVMEITRHYILYKPISLELYNKIKLYATVSFKQERPLEHRQ